MKKIKYMLLIAGLMFASLGADCNDRPTSRSFSIHTMKAFPTANGSRLVDGPGTQASGQWLSIVPGEIDFGGSQGFGIVTTNGTGRFAITNGRVIGNWRLSEHNGECAGLSFEDKVFNGEEQPMVCNIGFTRFFNVFPGSIDALAPPAIFTITGDSMSAAYGMPLIDYYDASGTIIAEICATAIADDGTWIQANVPDLSSVYTGSYLITIRNATPAGTWDIIGTAPVDIYGNDPPPPAPAPGGDPCSCPPAVECTPCFAY